MNEEFSLKATSLPDLPKGNLSILSLEEKIDKVLSIFESIDEVDGYTVVKFKSKIILGSDKELGLVSGTNVVIKTIDGGIFLN
jgi:hypothetical protein